MPSAKFRRKRGSCSATPRTRPRPAQEPPLPSLGHQDGASMPGSRSTASSCGNPDFTNAPGHGDDDARYYNRQQAYVHAPDTPPRPPGVAPKPELTIALHMRISLPRVSLCMRQSVSESGRHSSYQLTARSRRVAYSPGRGARRRERLYPRTHRANERCKCKHPATVEQEVC